METIVVSGRREFIDEVLDARIDEDPLPISRDGAEELWKVWDYRARNGGDDYLVFIPEWMAESSFDRKWPYFFAEVEYDDDSKAAVLFRNARLIDPSIIENGVWSEVSMSDILEVADATDGDFVDSKGETWVPRSYSAIFERGEDA